MVFWSGLYTQWFNDSRKTTFIYLPRKHILQILEVKNCPSIRLVNCTSHCLICWITHPSIQASTCRYRESAARGVPYWCAKDGARLRSAWSTHKKPCRGRFGPFYMVGHASTHLGPCMVRNRGVIYRSWNVFILSPFEQVMQQISTKVSWILQVKDGLRMVSE